MKKIVIVNGLGFGLEVAGWIAEMPGYNHDFRLKGFLDDRPSANGLPGLPVIGTHLDYYPDTDDALVVALSNPELKKITARRFEALGSSFFTVIHPSSVISTNSSIGKGCIIAPFNSVSNATVLGDFVSLYGFCRVGHDATIGSFCHIASHCSISGFCEIPEGSYVNELTHISKNTK